MSDLFADTTDRDKDQIAEVLALPCTLCQGVCSWACFSKSPDPTPEEHEYDAFLDHQDWCGEIGKGRE